MNGERDVKVGAHPASSTRSYRVAIVLAAAGLAVVSGCGGGDRRSQEEFSMRMERIHQQGSELWGRLAEQAGDLKPEQRLPATIREPMSAMADFQRSTAEELEQLAVPRDAEEEVQEFIEALRERTRIFDQATEVGKLTQHDFEQLARAGEQIDAALEQLRAEGFLPRVDEHED